MVDIGVLGKTAPRATLLANSSSVLKWVTLSATKGLKSEHVEMFCWDQYDI